ncbi:MAG TPA: hypothetical protein VFP84_29380 [Kofleriaceae bacterium]|nr:hypothetical protein [Kofleriaceae bacterium]
MQTSNSAIRFLRTAASHTVRIWTLVAARHDDPVRADIAAMCRVVRVRQHLTPEQQAMFDQLAIDYPMTILGLLVDRSDPEAVAAVQRQLDAVAHTMPPSC